MISYIHHIYTHYVYIYIYISWICVYHFYTHHIRISYIMYLYIYTYILYHLRIYSIHHLNMCIYIYHECILYLYIYICVCIVFLKPPPFSVLKCLVPSEGCLPMRCAAAKSLLQRPIVQRKDGSVFTWSRRAQVFSEVALWCWGVMTYKWEPEKSKNMISHSHG